MTHAITKTNGAPVVPVLRYRNLPAAIDWLCGAFGFEKHRITADRAGTVMFAQLTFGSAMIMLGPVRDSAFDKFLKQPDEVGGAETQVCYFFVADAHAHCARAKAAGAAIIFDIADQANGGRSYSCRDPEGHLWNFGTYDPWQRQTALPREPDARTRVPRSAVLALGVGVLAVLGIGVVPLGHAPDTVQTRPFADIETASIPSTRDSVPEGVGPGQDQDAERDAKDGELGTKAPVTQATTDLRDLLAQALKDRNAAEQAAKATREQLEKAWIRKAVAEKAAREARRQLARERSARTQGTTYSNPLLGSQ